MPNKCKEIMTPDPVCCLPSDTADDAAQLMRDQDVGPVPVCQDEQSRKLLGIITDRDLALKVVAEGRDPEGTRVEEIMTVNVVTCGPDDDIDKVMELMERHQVRRIPVIDSGGRILGIIAQADLATRAGRPEKTAEVVEEISKPKTRAGGV